MSQCSPEMRRRADRLERKNDALIVLRRSADHQLLAARGIIARQAAEIVRLRGEAKKRRK